MSIILFFGAIASIWEISTFWTLYSIGQGLQVNNIPKNQFRQSLRRISKLGHRDDAAGDLQLPSA